MKDNPELTELIQKASTQAFEEWRAANPTERVFVFCLSTLDDANYVNASLNSEESHQRRLVEHGLDPSSEFALETKWGPWEWENEYIGQSHFAPVDEKLRSLYDEMREESFPLYRSTVIESMLAALLQLKHDSVINNQGDTSSILLFATIYDSFEAESLQRGSIELLNPPDIGKEFLSVFGD